MILSALVSFTIVSLSAIQTPAPQQNVSAISIFFFIIYLFFYMLISQECRQEKHTQLCLPLVDTAKLSLTVHGINCSFGFLHNTFTSLFWQKKRKKENYFIKHLFFFFFLHVVWQVRGWSTRKLPNFSFDFLTSVNTFLMSLCSQTLISNLLQLSMMVIL